MKKEYKETFNQVTISETAVNKIIKSARTLRSRDPQEKGHGIPQIAAVFLIMVLLFALAVPVLAIEGFNFFGVFKGLFGDTAEIVEESGSLPVVDVRENSFTNIDITVTGIAGDNNLIYIIMDIARKDGKGFKRKWTEMSGFNVAKLEQIRLNETQNMNKNIREDTSQKEKEFIDYSQGTSQWWVRLEDDHPRDNVITLAFIVDIETMIDGEEVYIPGETYILTLGGFKDEATSFLNGGLWRGEFVADYRPPETITKEVHKEAKFPDWGTSDQFTYGFTLGRFELTPFALRYHCDDYAEYIRADMDETWPCLYVEMKDGSTKGYKTHDEYIGRLWEYKSLFLSSSGDSILNGEIIQENSSLMVFEQPIDLNEVKAVHFGDLTVPIEYKGH